MFVQNLHNIRTVLQTKQYLHKQLVVKKILRGKNVYAKHKRNNIFYSFFFQQLLNDLFRSGKLLKSATAIYNGFVTKKKDYLLSATTINHFIFKKCILPFQTSQSNKKRNGRIDSKPINVYRQLILTRRLIVNSLKITHSLSLTSKINDDFFSILIGRSSSLNKLLKMKYRR